MSLSELIGGKNERARFATATPATFATQGGERRRTVASVATVAVASPKDEKTAPPVTGDAGTLEFSEQYRARELEPLTTDEERAILAWLAAVGETDTSTISEVLAKCQRDARARAYVIDLASELPPPAPPGPVRCGDCAHFERSSHHPNLGHCASGQPEAAAGLADADLRRCSRFNRLENGGRAEYAN